MRAPCVGLLCQGHDGRSTMGADPFPSLREGAFAAELGSKGGIHHTEWGPMVAVYVGVGAVCVMLIAVAGFIVAMRKHRLNWYEKNLLEISQADPEFVRYQRRSASFDDAESTGSCPEQWSRESKSHWWAEKTDGSTSAGEGGGEGEAAAATAGRSRSVCSKKSGKRSKRSNSATASVASLKTTDEVSSIPPDFFVPKLYEHRRKQSKIVKAAQHTALQRKQTVSTGNASMFRDIGKGEIDRQLYDVRQDSMASDDIVFGQCGALQIAASYDAAIEVFNVRILQAADLTAKRSDDVPTPYFKVAVMVNHKTLQQYTSKVYDKTRSTEVNEDFFFTLSPEQFQQAKLEILIYHHEQFTVDECIGCCLLTLAKLEIPTNSEEKAVFWAEVLPIIEEEEPENYGGDILFRVQYLSKAQRLSVTIFRARHIFVPDEVVSEPPDAVVRVSLSMGNKPIKKKKTSVKRATYSPTWNESLSFAIGKTSVCELTLEICVCHEPSLFISKPLSKVEVKLSKDKELWKAFMKGSSETPAKWYRLERIAQ